MELGKAVVSSTKLNGMTKSIWRENYFLYLPEKVEKDALQCLQNDGEAASHS